MKTKSHRVEFHLEADNIRFEILALREKVAGPEIPQPAVEFMKNVFH